MPSLSASVVRTFSSKVELVHVDHVRLNLAMVVNRLLLTGEFPEIAKRTSRYQISVVPETKRQSLMRYKERMAVALRECCLPGTFTGLLVLSKANRPTFLERMKQYHAYFRKAIKMLKKLWGPLTREARRAAIDLIQVQYAKTDPLYRPPYVDLVANKFLGQFDARVTEGPAVVLPTWTFFQVPAASSSNHRIMGYQHLDVRLRQFLRDSHTAAVEVVKQRIGYAAELDLTVYAAPKDFRHRYVTAFTTLQLDLWWQWFEVFRDKYMLEAISPLGASWEELRRQAVSQKHLVPGGRLTILKKITQKLRGSCVEALQKLASHPAVGSPPIISGGVK